MHLGSICHVRGYRGGVVRVGAGGGGQYNQNTCHLPAAIGNMMIMMHKHKEYHEKYVEHVGPDCIVQFVDYIEEMCCKIDSWEHQFYTRCEADRTEYDKIVFDGATACYICGVFFTAHNKKNFDHCHLTDRF